MVGRKMMPDRSGSNGSSRRSSMVVVVMILFSAMLVVGALLDALEVIEAGHKGVIIISPSGPSEIEVDEGYHWELRLVWADVRHVEYRTQTVHFVGSDFANDQTGSIQIITNDSVPIFMDLSIIYHIQPDKVADLIIENGLDYRDRIILPYARSIVRDVASHYAALSIIGDKRSTVETAITVQITEKFAEKYIVVEGVAMRDIRIPDSLENAIIQKKVAEQNVLTQQYNLAAQQFVANRTIINAQANATSAAITAGGSANATVIKAKGNAQAIDIVMAALNSSDVDNRTKDYLTYAYLQALTDPNSNIQYIIIPSDGGVPILIGTKPE